MDICLDDETFSYAVETKNGAEVKDLISLLEKQDKYPKIYWSDRSQRKEKIAWGKSLTLNKLPRDIRAPGGLSFFLVKRFSHSKKNTSPWLAMPEQIFLLPEEEIIQEENKTLWVRHSTSQQECVLHESFIETSFDIPDCWQEMPSKEEWEKNIKKALHTFSSGAMQKVVLSRQSSYKIPHSCSPYDILRALKKGQHSTTVFLLEIAKDIAFIGSTPEKLYSREGADISTEALAGTVSNDAYIPSEEMDKLLREVGYVETFIEKALQPIAKVHNRPQDFSFLHTKTLTHLYKKITASLDPNICDDDILAALHPTAAVAGLERDSALSFIESIEKHDRGYYAGPIGWVGSSFADISVAIRSALYYKKHIFLYAGAGIIQGSDPTSEWQELEKKTAQFKEFLRGI